MLTKSDPTGGTTNYTYDSLGRVVQITDPLSEITLLSYATAFPNNTTTINDPRGNATRHTYLSNRLMSVVQNPGTGQQATYTYTWGNGYDNGLASVTDPNSHTTSNNWDSRGNLLSTIDPLGHTTTYTYDAANNRVQIFKVDGTFVTKFGSEGSGAGQFDNPSAVHVDREG